VWVRVGSADELPSEAGLAHVHEHMLFKGTELRGVGQVAREIEAAGGEINAYTSFDQTVYHCVMSNRFLDVGLDVLADVTQRPLFDEDELKRELDVIVEEIGRLQDSAGRVTVQELFRTAFKVHSYREPVIGTVESVLSMNSEKVRAFFKRWYTGRNIVVVVTGDIDEFQAEEKVAAAFQDVETGVGRSERMLEPRQDALRYSRVSSHFRESHLNMAFHIPACSHPDTPVLDLMALILGQGDSSRLARTVKRRDRLVNDVLSYAYTPRDPGLFAVSASLPEQAAVGSIVEAVLGQMHGMRLDLCTENELSKARHIIESQQVYGRETVQGVARRLGYYAVVAGSHEEEAKYYDRIRATTREDVLRVARTYLVPENLSIVHLASEGEEAVVSRERLEEVAQTTMPALAPPSAIDVPSVAEEPVSQAPAIKTASRGNNQESLSEYSIPGGPRLLILRDKTLPIVAIRALTQGGLPFELPDKGGSGRLMSTVLTLGTESRTANEMAVTVESLAGYLDAFSGRDVAGVRCGFLSQHLDEGWELFAETMREPAFLSAEIERERALQLEDIRCQADRPASLTIRKMTEQLYEGHPHGKPVLGTEESVSSLTREDLLNYYNQVFHPSRLVLTVVGDVEPDHIVDLLGSLLPDRDRYATAQAETGSPSMAMTSSCESRLRGEGTQAHVAIGFHGLCFSDLRRPTLDVLLTVLSGQSGRLFLDLRDRKSLAYSVNASSFEGADSGFVYAYMGTSPDKVQQAKRGLEEALSKLVNERISPSELERAQRYVVGVHDIGLQRYAMRAAHYGINSIYGVKRSRFEEYGAEVESVTRDDVQALAAQIIDFDRSSVVLFEPEKSEQSGEALSRNDVALMH